MFAEEVAEHAEPRRAALLRVKLRGDDVTLLHGRHILGAAVRGRGQGPVRVGGRLEHPERVHEVDLARAVDAVQHVRAGLVAPECHTVPADVGHRQLEVAVVCGLGSLGAGGRAEVGHAARNDAEALRAGRLLRRLEEQLHAEADAEEWAARAAVRAQRLNPTARLEDLHCRAERPNAREDKHGRGGDVRLALHIVDRVAKRSDRVPHTADVPSSVV
mmetsp:Transcript_3340/g.6960  ORF Transcript_3340/g.6960 Transcript_3340/m.6960 type:complete len:217 (-) Transcript_3340:135-785(-)